MDAASRAAQAELVAALLASLTPKDKINLATCDVECHWVFEQVRSRPTPRTSTRRGSFSPARISLGWTDLDKAMASALPSAVRAGRHRESSTIGDGIPTTGDADPVAFAKRLRRLAEGQCAAPFHAVAVGQ